MIKAREEIGYILSRASTKTALVQPRKEWENKIREGMLLVINDKGRHILGVVSKIEIYNEFYEPGDVWSEAIREGTKPPQTLARKYTIAYVELLGVIDSGLTSVDKPPEPGSEVYLATSNIMQSLLSRKGSLINIGSLYGYKESELQAYLDIGNVTMHAAILGVTGSGKSNTIGVLIEELGSQNNITIGSFESRTLPLFVVDAHGDYIDYYIDPDLVQAYDKVYRLIIGGREVASSDPSRAETLDTRLDLNVYSDNLSELAELIYTTVRGGIEGLELQLSLLTYTLNDVVSSPPTICTREDGKGDLNCLIRGKGFRDLLRKLESLGKEVGHHTTIEAVKRTLRSFYELISRYELVPEYSNYSTLNEDFVDDIVDPEAPKLVILDFSADGSPGIDLKIKQFVLSFIARLLFKKFLKYRVTGTDRALAIVIEEAQNYAPNPRLYPIGYSVARNILATIATQGRKFGLSLILVTQRPLFVDPVILSMMNTFIIHRVSPEDVRFVNTVTGGLPEHIRNRLTRLETGVAIVTGQMNPLPYPVLVHVRKRKSHKIGSLGG